MMSIRLVKILMCFSVVAVLSFLPFLAARASKSQLSVPSFQDAVASPPFYLTLGKADLIDVRGDVADVLVANPGVVDVVAVQANRLYVVGLRPGDTNLIVLDGEGHVVKRVDLHVRYDVSAIQDMVDTLFPEEKIRVSSVHDQILLRGTVESPDMAAKVANVVAHYVSELQDESGRVDELLSNMLEVRNEQQVMLQVRVIEASRSIGRELGIGVDSSNPSGGTSTALAVATGGGIGLSQDPAATIDITRFSGFSELGFLDLELNALEEEGMVSVLAEPNLTAMSGQQAGFLAGGEFPVPTGRDNVGNLTIEFREFGVSLNFLPIVLSDERISLQLNTEVSSLDNDNAIVLADVTVPGLDIRRASTTVEVQSGGSLMIAGLLKSEATEGMTGLPGFNRIPVLGKLLSSESFQRSETELIVIVTPYLVRPFTDKDTVDPVPAQDGNVLARVFATNVRDLFDFDKDDDEEMFAVDERYGYLLK